MPILGAHMSIAGGYHKAVRAAHAAGCDCVQLFTKNNNQWRAKPLTDKDGDDFKAALKELKIVHPIAHDSYLINLGSPDDELWKKSIDALVVELQRAAALGVPYVVAHPGAFTTSSEEAGIKRIAKGLDEVHRQTDGEVAGAAGEHRRPGIEPRLAVRAPRRDHLAKAADPDRLGVCIDTCHAFAAGYAMGTKKEFLATFRELDKTVGLDRLKAFHVNDSLKPFGSRVDRHAAIGRGEMGIEPFRFLMNDRRFKKTPMYLETPKGEENGEDLDVINLRTLRGLVEKK